MTGDSAPSGDGAADPAGKVLEDLYATLERRSYKTYTARMQASFRLAARNRGWNAALISTSAATTIASVGMLADQTMYGNAGSTLLVCVAILALIASLVTSGIDYSGRSRNMFLNYRRIQRLSSKIERAAKCNSTRSVAQIEEFNEEYDALLDESENHTEADYKRASGETQLSWSVFREKSLTWMPYVSLLAPIALVIPVVKWIWSGGP